MAYFALLVFALAAQAAPEPQDPKKKSQFGQYLTAQEAYAFLQQHPKDSLFLDIRTREEVNFLGVPSLIDANVPYENMLTKWDKKKNEFGMALNKQFVIDVDGRVQGKGLNKDAPIVLICRSGTRSAKAADMLVRAGYKTVYTVVDGYEGDKSHAGPDQGKRIVNGWRNAGLPWTYTLDPAKMYLPVE